MTQIKDLFKFRKNYLAMTIGLILLPSAHAMQELSDSSLSDTTGEGLRSYLMILKWCFKALKIFLLVPVMPEVLKIRDRRIRVLFALFQLVKTMKS